MVGSAHYILGPFGKDSDLRRHGEKIASRGGKNAKKRAVVAVARKLSVLLHRLWVSGEAYEPLRATPEERKPTPRRGHRTTKQKGGRPHARSVTDAGEPIAARVVNPTPDPRSPRAPATAQTDLASFRRDRS